LRERITVLRDDLATDSGAVCVSQGYDLRQIGTANCEGQRHPCPLARGQALGRGRYCFSSLPARLSVSRILVDRVPGGSKLSEARRAPRGLIAKARVIAYLDVSRSKRARLIVGQRVAIETHFEFEIGPRHVANSSLSS